MYATCAHDPAVRHKAMQCSMRRLASHTRLFQDASKLCGWYSGFQACSVHAVQTVDDYSASKIQASPPLEYFCPMAL